MVPGVPDAIIPEHSQAEQGEVPTYYRDFLWPTWTEVMGSEERLAQEKLQL